MKFLISLLLICFWLQAAAQQSQRDSLENILRHTGADTSRVIILNKASALYYSNNPDKVRQYAEEAMTLARQLGYGRGIGRSYLSFGVYYLTQGQYQRAIDSTKRALPYFEQLNDELGIATVYSNVGLDLKHLGNLSQAADYYFKGLKLFEKGGNQINVAKTFNTIGVLFKEQEKYDQALYYYWQSFRKGAGVDPRSQAGALLNIGQIYQYKKDFPRAITYLNQSRSRFVALNEPLGLVMCDNNLGNIYLQMKQYDQAELLAQRALQRGKELNYTPNVITSLLILGDVRVQTNRAPDSFSYLDKAQSLAEKTHQQAGRLSVYKSLAEANAKTGNFTKAYQFQSRWIALKDSVFTQESAKKIAGVQADYKADKKQAEIELLKKDQQVSAVWRNSIGAGLLALLVIAGLVLSRQRLKIRSNQAVLTQSQLVTQTNKQLEAQTHLLEDQATVLLAQAQQLQALDETKSRFFTNVTHEFRTPLTLIIGTLSEKMHLLAENTETVIRRTEITVMYRNAQRLLHHINQLLDLSKIESHGLGLRLQTDDVKPLLTIVAGLFSSLAGQRHIRLSMHLSPHPLLVSHDAEQLEKVLTNLLSNAFKFTPDGGEITLRAEPIISGNSTFIQLIVEDSGIGIAPDQAERVFERFYQGVAPRTDRQPGTGVGLSLAKEIIQLHNGMIRVESKPGSGARFVVLLPVVDVDMPFVGNLVLKTALPGRVFSAFNLQPDRHPLPQVQARDERPLLLIVEDNDDVRTFIRNQMEPYYQVLEGENGLQGLQLAHDNLPDLVISDWMMPDMDGIEFCHRLKTDERISHIPFMLLTALASQDKLLTGLQTGADEYLTKPFDSRELLLRSQNLIASRRILRERFSREIRVQPKDITVTSADEKFLVRVIDLVEENMSDADFSAEQFGREIGMSRMQLHRKLVALTGQSASDFIRLMRLKRAAQLFESQTGNVSEIAYSVGFNSLSYFAKCFRDQFGVSPSTYQSRLCQSISSATEMVGEMGSV